MSRYYTDRTEQVLAQGRNWNQDTENRREQAINGAAQFLGVERPQRPADKLANLQHLLSGIAAN